MAGGRVDVWRALSRWQSSDGLVEQTRRLFFLLVLVSTALVQLRPLTAIRAVSPWLVVAGYAALLAIWAVRLVTRQAALVSDVVEAAAIGGLTAAYLDPVVVFTFAFPALWYRGLYGSTRRVVLHYAMVSVALTAVMDVVSGLPLRIIASLTVIGVLPTMVVARYLGMGLFAREQAQRRDAALVRLGSGLIGIADPDRIRELAHECTAAIAAASPRLRVVVVRELGTGLMVMDLLGAFREPPTTLPVVVVPADRRRETGPAADVASLTDAAGVAMPWLVIPALHACDIWIIVGMPSRVPTDVVVALKSMLNQVGLAMQSSAARQSLATQATTDALTGLANRAAFGTALHERLGGPADRVTLLLLDLDDFKIVNDGLGHPAGDELLRHVADRLRHAVREQDLCARLGGDEFAVVVAGPEHHAVDVGQRLVELVAAPVTLQAGRAQVGVSIGVAVPGPDTTADELVQQADIAMYAAKAKGKNRVQLFNPTLLREDGEAAFEAELAESAASQLVVHYQPIIAVADDRCVAVEALARWQHPTRGLLLPSEFIATAERTGAIARIGAEMLRRACRDVAGWRDEHGRLAVHVNVAAAQLAEPGFVDLVRACIRDHDLVPRQLVLEITETMVLDAPATRATLHTLTTVGAAVAIDDFGTGYSALSTLRTLPLDIVKLDKSFLDGGPSALADEAVIGAVVQVAARLGLQVIAEGVERRDQQAFLASVGVGASQGYLHHRPAPAGELRAWLAARTASTDGTVTPLGTRRTG